VGMSALTFDKSAECKSKPADIESLYLKGVCICTPKEPGLAALDGEVSSDAGRVLHGNIFNQSILALFCEVGIAIAATEHKCATHPANESTLYKACLHLARQPFFPTLASALS
jgi:hypothetical protein